MSSSRNMRRRQERQEQEANAEAQERRQRMIRLGVVALFAAIIVVGIMVAVSQSGSDDEDAVGLGAATTAATSTGADTDTGEGGAEGGSDVAGVDEVNELLAGLEQDGTVLGGPDPEVAIIEFGDLQCPVCRVFSEDVVKPLIENEVRDGTATIEFRNWTILGEDSVVAAKAALAAANQGRYWQFVELFYANQGTENSGYVSDRFLLSIAEAAGVKDIDQWEADRQSGKLDAELAQINEQASNAGFGGTPSFMVQGPGGDQVLGTATIAQIRAAINDASGA